MIEDRGSPEWLDRIRRSSVPEDQLIETNCPVCGSSSRRQLIVERGYPLWKCLSCTHVYISPRPSRQWLSDLYSSSYMPDTDTEEYWEVGLDDIFKATARSIREYHPQKGDLLDVGAGFGGFLVRAGEDGWRLHGIEPNAAAFAVAKKRLGDRAALQEAVFETADLQPESYDGILRMNVIEHVCEPLESCRRAYTLLRPGGFLGLRWPQMSAKNLLRERLKSSQSTDRAIIGAPAHLHDYTRQSIEKLFVATGFEDVRHAWAGTRRAVNAGFKSKFVLKVASGVALGMHRLTGGRRVTPFIARLSLGRKPS